MPTALHHMRLRRGQSLRALAADIGCSYQTVHRLERGLSVEARPSTRVAFERVLGVPFEILTMNANGDARRDAAAGTVTTAERSSELPHED